MLGGCESDITYEFSGYISDQIYYVLTMYYIQGRCLKDKNVVFVSLAESTIMWVFIKIKSIDILTKR